MPKHFNGGIQNVPIVSNLSTQAGKVIIGNVRANLPDVPVVANRAIAQQTVRARMLAGQLGQFVRSLAPGRPPLE